MHTKKATTVYLDYRESDCAHQTVQSYEYRLNKFEGWWGDRDIGEMTKQDVHEWKQHLNDQDLAKPTIKSHIDTLRGFLAYMARLDYVDDDLVDVADSPTLSKGDNVRDDEVEADVATQILQRLDRFDYASMRHALILLLWRTSMRTGAVRSLDLGDYNPNEQYLRLEHRPGSETPLKNQGEGERMVAISEETCRILDDYIAEKRVDIEDEHGREPLLTTKHGRIARNTVRKWCYRLTRPCWFSGECPHDRELDECRGSVERSDNYAYECPDSVAAHAFRRGSITHFLRNDMPETVVSDRANVSTDVLDKHYDRRNEREKMEQRRVYLDNI
ncbi:tyrosine-type recombinase/integrase [Natronosalvus amylolyticus]|uniref:tyrosine-type recombinase/integrase n=1 Tax=Natronosalvus amylolyticus TaxID=2961994 RepID=UPI0020C9A094|nr:site-specific integrase [Natronosalvus amylolyticus]